MLLAALALSPAGSAAGKPAVLPGSGAPPQADLDFRIRKFFFTADSRVRWRRLPADRARAELMAVVEGPARSPEERGVVRLELDIRHFLGRLRRVVWFDPATGLPLQVREESDGDTLRIWRYLEDGVVYVRERRREGATEVFRDRTTWEDDASRAMIEADTLLYLLPASGLERPGDSRRFVLRVKGRPVTVVARVVEGARHLCRVEGKDAAAQGAFLPIVLDAAARGEDALRAVGLRAPLEVCLDRRTRTPMRVRSRLKWIGWVEARRSDRG